MTKVRARKGLGRISQLGSQQVKACIVSKGPSQAENFISGAVGIF